MRVLWSLDYPASLVRVGEDFRVIDLVGISGFGRCGDIAWIASNIWVDGLGAFVIFRGLAATSVLSVVRVDRLAEPVCFYIFRHPAVALAAGEGVDGKAPVVRGDCHMGRSGHHRVSSCHVVAGTHAILEGVIRLQDSGERHRPDRLDHCRRCKRGYLSGYPVSGTAAGKTG